MAADPNHPSSRTTIRQERPTHTATARYWARGSATRNSAEARVPEWIMRVHLMWANEDFRRIMSFGRDHPNDVPNIFWPPVPSSASSRHWHPPEAHSRLALTLPLEGGFLPDRLVSPRG